MDSDTLQNLINAAKEAHSDQRFSDAINFYQKLTDLLPESPEIFLNLGTILKKTGNFKAARENYSRALNLRPKFVEALFNLANLAAEEENYDEAIGLYHKILNYSQPTPELLNNLAIVFLKTGRLENAISKAQESIKLRPNFVDGLTTLGNTFQRSGNLVAAEGPLAKAEQLDQDNPICIFNHGSLLQAIGKREVAMEKYNRAINLRPNYIEAHVKRAALKIANGNLTAGFSEFEWRAQWSKNHPFFKRLKMANIPAWSNDKLHKKNILIWNDQGYGDIIQCSRFIFDLLNQENQVILEAEKPIVSLLKTIKGVKSVISADELLPDADIAVPYMSLPHLLNINLSNLKNTGPYLIPPSNHIKKWVGLLGPKTSLRIGIAWAGNPHQAHDHTRSIPLKFLKPLLNLTNIHFHSLLIGKNCQGIKNKSTFYDHSQDIKDFSDLAALISLMDLTISVCSAPAHLAGAMGAPVWVALSFDPDGRWLFDRLDSPWYPSAKLFRQPAPGDWKSVISNMARSLKKFNQNAQN